ncbi:MAG: trypsin-like peptidase domain-containing protein [Pirellulaceae bacterium]|jgi:serine protease Do|nr:trypsin-like peptidase domain-containing protein [Pirellulaceae bacterium]
MSSPDHQRPFEPAITNPQPRLDSESQSASAGVFSERCLSSTDGIPSPPLTPLQHAAPPRSPGSSGGFASQVFWIFCCAAFVFGLWQLGPIVAERYQYSISRGKALAEYEVARQALNDFPLTAVSQAYQMVAQKIRPSVVSITCQKNFGVGQGSGLIISEDGYIVTNRHVIEQAQDVVVILHDRQEFKAAIIGEDVETDLALLKINARGLIAADWGDSKDLAVGSIVWAVGSPFGYTQTVTSGIVSGKNRLTTDQRGQRDGQFKELIQTDAAVNPGNSGGPLVDASGRVVGINTSILGETFQGVSFAVPSSVAQFVTQQLLAKGRVERGYFGFLPSAVEAKHQNVLNLPDLYGALVLEVVRDSPAANAGLKSGDVIRSWNGEKIDDFNRVYNLIGVTPPEKTVSMEIMRDGNPLQLDVTVTQRPTELLNRR